MAKVFISYSSGDSDFAELAQVSSGKRISKFGLTKRTTSW